MYEYECWSAAVFLSASLTNKNLRHGVSLLAFPVE